MKLSQPSVVIVGAGLMGRWHASTLRWLNIPVRGVVDADYERARAFGSAIGAPAFRSTEAMLEQVRPDAAHVCTPLATHVGYSEQLLNAGCHVMCEKPLAASALEVRSLLDTSRATGAALCPVHQFALQRGVREVAARIDELGELRRISFTFCSAGGVHLKEAQLDDVILDIAPHPFSVLARLVPAMDIAQMRWQAVHPAPGELIAIGEFAQMCVSLTFSMSARPTEATATITGTKGSAYIDFFHGFSFIAQGTVSRLQKAMRPLTLATTHFATASLNLARRGIRNERAYPGLRTLLSEFYRNIASKGGPPLPSTEILATYGARDSMAQQILGPR